MSNVNTSNTQVTPFVWGEISLSQTVMVDGVPHATREAVGEWLEYADAAEGVRKLLNRNSYIEAHGIPVNLTGMGGAREYETRAYHPIGFLLIVMESGTPKAIAMKQAVAAFVWHFVGRKPLSHKERIELLKLRRTILNDLGRNKDAFVQKALFSDLVEISLTLGQPVPDIKYLGKDVNQLLLEGV